MWKCRAGLVLAALAGFVLPATCQEVSPPGLRAIARSSLRGREGAVLVAEIQSGKLLVTANRNVAARRLAAPGSAVKPFVLLALLRSGRIDPAKPSFCERKLMISGRRFDCTHPADNAWFDAAQALAYSCNSYFAKHARALAPEELRAALERSGLFSTTGWLRGEESGIAEHWRTPEQVQLAALGSEGLEVTPVGLLAAYRKLALERQQSPNDPALQVVFRGLADSTDYGTGRAASGREMPVAGKTGTARSRNSTRSHGWFVGLAPADAPRVVVAVYLDNAHGYEAAAVARQVLGAYARQREGR